MSKSENKYRRNSKGEWEERTPRGGSRNGRSEYYGGGRDSGRGSYGAGGRDGGRGSYGQSKRDDRKYAGKPGDRHNFDKKTDRRSGEGYDARSERRFDAGFEKRGYADNQPEESANIIIGRNPVMEALKSGREIDKLLVANGAEGSIIKILGMAKDLGIPVMYSEKTALDRVSGGKVHQGVAAYVPAHEYSTVDDILEIAKSRSEDPFVIILDNIEDPHNLGAIMRTAETAGAHGIIIPKRRAVGLTDVVAKASAGAIEYMPVAKVSNISQTIESLKEQGLWIAACDMGENMYYEANLTGPMGLVIGAEGEGISRLVKEKCDFVVSIPMLGKITSLNASNAAAILIYEICKQRLLKK